jgi:aspartate 1-decarboxylase
MIYRTMLKSKIHRATVTDANLEYEGSITVDRAMLDAADILEHEKVQVLNLSNGNRLETYAIPGDEGSGVVCVNGAAARLVARGDKVIVVSYAVVENDQARSFPTKVVLVDEENRISAVKRTEPLLDTC